MAFDMPPHGSWSTRGGWLARALAREFTIGLRAGSGIAGNLGYESAGLTQLHERGQPDGKGGYGWAQWTGPRRRAFFNFCELRNFDPSSDIGNYRYLLYELHYSHSYVIQALKQTQTIETAVFTVGYLYERPAGTTNTHLPGFKGRLAYAKTAFNGPQADAK